MVVVASFGVRIRELAYRLIEIAGVCGMAASALSPTWLQLHQAVVQAEADVERETPLAVAREPDYMTCWGPDEGLRRAHAPVRRTMRRLERAKAALKQHEQDNNRSDSSAAP
jgi:hypothetical protein